MIFITVETPVKLYWTSLTLRSAAVERSKDPPRSQNYHRYRSQQRGFRKVGLPKQLSRSHPPLTGVLSQVVKAWVWHTRTSCLPIDSPSSVFYSSCHVGPLTYWMDPVISNVSRFSFSRISKSFLKYYQKYTDSGLELDIRPTLKL